MKDGSDVFVCSMFYLACHYSASLWDFSSLVTVQNSAGLKNGKEPLKCVSSY